jgi:hypothetical protein
MAAYNNSSEDGAARDEEGYGAAYQHEYSGAPTEVPDEVGAAYVSPGTRSAAQNDTVAVYCLDCDDTPAAAPAAKRRAAADQPGASCYSSAVAAGEALPRASQVRVQTQCVPPALFLLSVFLVRYAEHYITTVLVLSP